MVGFVRARLLLRVGSGCRRSVTSILSPHIICTLPTSILTQVCSKLLGRSDASQSSSFPHGAMHRFMSSVASSSSGRAERPATVPGSSSSAEQPATSFPSAATSSYLKILSIRDVQRWLAEGPIVSCSSADVERIREAVAVLSYPKPRKQVAAGTQRR